MSTEQYSIRPDVERRLLKITLTGCFDEATAQRYQAEVSAAFIEMRRSGEPFDALIDMREFGVQIASVASSMEKFMRTIREIGPRKIAIIVGTVLLKMQITRLVPDESYRIFTGTSEAVEWLERQMKARSNL